MNSNPTLCAYFAGLIDGEGYIGVKRRLPTKRNNMVSPKYSVAFSIAMTDREPIQMLADLRGGTVKRRLRGTNKPIYQLDYENSQAVSLLRDVQPYLVAKKRQAELALQFAALRVDARKHRTKASIHSAARILSDEYVGRCDFLHDLLKRMSPRSGNGARFHA